MVMINILWGVSRMTKFLTEKKQIDPRSYLVVQANDFIRHPRTDKLSALEANIAYFLISKVKPEDYDFLQVTFTIKEFCQICGTDEFNDSGKNYRGIKDALKSLADKSAWVEVKNGVHQLVRWVDTYIVTDRDGTITATLSQSIKPFLLSLSDHYSQAELRNYIALKSIYSKRLYDLLRSYIYSGVENTRRYIFPEFEISDLKKQLNAENYTNFKDFRVNALERAKNEINAVTDIEMDFEHIKPGRKVTHIRFTLKLKSPPDRLTAMIKANKLIECSNTKKLTAQKKK